MSVKADREEIANDLRSLGVLLVETRVCLDNSPLMRAASNIQDDKFLPGTKWGYRLEGLLFKPGKPKGVMPKSLDDFLIELSVYVEIDKQSNPEDPFLSLAVDIEKSGVSLFSDKALKAAWHLDKHQYDEANSVHPLYHFQLGGKRMKGEDIDLGRTFITPPPRLMHPPMDGIIAIDFILGNYWHEKWLLLKDNMIYKDMIERSHRRYWAPFFNSIADYFNEVKLDSYDKAKRNCPFLY